FVNKMDEMEVVPGRGAGSVGDVSEVFLVQVGIAWKGGIGVEDRVAVRIRFTLDQPTKDSRWNAVRVLDAAIVGQTELQECAVRESSFPMTLTPILSHRMGEGRNKAVANKGTFVFAEVKSVGDRHQFLLGIGNESVRARKSRETAISGN